MSACFGSELLQPLWAQRGRHRPFTSGIRGNGGIITRPRVHTSSQFTKCVRRHGISLPSRDGGVTAALNESY